MPSAVHLPKVDDPQHLIEFAEIFDKVFFDSFYFIQFDEQLIEFGLGNSDDHILILKTNYKSLKSNLLMSSFV